MAESQFTEAQKTLIVNAIGIAEKATSGEIRVHIEQHCREDVMDRAAFIFEKLDMHKTKLRNGVLFYVSMADHKLAILGDAGINAKVPEGFWDQIKEHLFSAFKQKDYAGGLSDGIVKAGEQLKKHFPWQTDDKNELSDEISFGS